MARGNRGRPSRGARESSHRGGGRGRGGNSSGAPRNKNPRDEELDREVLGVFTDSACMQYLLKRQRWSDISTYVQRLLLALASHTRKFPQTGEGVVEEASVVVLAPLDSRNLNTHIEARNISVAKDWDSSRRTIAIALIP